MESLQTFSCTYSSHLVLLNVVTVFGQTNLVSSARNALHNVSSVPLEQNAQFASVDITYSWIQFKELPALKLEHASDSVQSVTITQILYYLLTKKSLIAHSVHRIV